MLTPKSQFNSPSLPSAPDEGDEVIDFEELRKISTKLNNLLHRKHPHLKPHEKHPYDVLMDRHHRLLERKKELEKQLKISQEEDRKKLPFINVRKTELEAQIESIREHISSMEMKKDENRNRQIDILTMPPSKDRYDQNKKIIDHNTAIDSLINNSNHLIGTIGDRLDILADESNFTLQTQSILQEIKHTSALIDKQNGLGEYIGESMSFLQQYLKWLDGHNSYIGNVRDYFFINHSLPPTIKQILPSEYLAEENFDTMKKFDSIADQNLKKNVYLIYRYNDLLLQVYKKLLVILAYYQKPVNQIIRRKYDYFKKNIRTISRIYIDNFDYLNKQFEKRYQSNTARRYANLGDGQISECLLIAMLNKKNYFIDGNINFAVFQASEIMDKKFKTDLVIGVRNNHAPASPNNAVYQKIYLLQVGSIQRYFSDKATIPENFTSIYSNKLRETWKKEVCMLAIGKHIDLQEKYLEDEYPAEFITDHLLEPLQQQAIEMEQVIDCCRQGKKISACEEISVDTLQKIKRNYYDLVNVFK